MEKYDAETFFISSLLLPLKMDRIFRFYSSRNLVHMTTMAAVMSHSYVPRALQDLDVVSCPRYVYVYLDNNRHFLSI